MVNPIVAEEIYKMPELRCRYQRILIHQFNNFYTVKILIYSAILTEIFMQFNNAVYMEVSQMSAVTLLYTLCCWSADITQLKQQNMIKGDTTQQYINI